MDDDNNGKAQGGENSFGFVKQSDENPDDENAMDDEELKDDNMDDSFDLDEVFDLNVSLDMLNTPVKKEDEFRLFSSTIKQLYSKSPQDFGIIVANFSDNDKKFTKELLQHQRIELSINGQ